MFVCLFVGFKFRFLVGSHTGTSIISSESVFDTMSLSVLSRHFLFSYTPASPLIISSVFDTMSRLSSRHFLLHSVGAAASHNILIRCLEVKYFMLFDGNNPPRLIHSPLSSFSCENLFSSALRDLGGG